MLRLKKEDTQNPEDESEQKWQSNPFSLEASEMNKPGAPFMGSNAAPCGPKCQHPYSQ